MNEIISIGIIDDQADFLQSFQHTISINDNLFNFFYASTADAALEWARRGNIDVLFVDLYLSDNDPKVYFEQGLVTVFRSINPYIKIVLYSSYVPNLQPEVLENYKNDGLMFVTKENLQANFSDIIKSLKAKQNINKLEADKNTYSESKQLLITDVNIVNKEWTKILKAKPQLIHDLTSRQFEEFIAEVWHKRGYNVELTQKTRDGGKDIYAYKRNSGLEFLFAIECKKYNPQNKVGRPIIQQLNGIVESERLTGGIIATTSYFSKDAIDFAKPLSYRIYLNDLTSIEEMLSKEI